MKCILICNTKQFGWYADGIPLKNAVYQEWWIKLGIGFVSLGEIVIRALVYLLV